MTSRFPGNVKLDGRAVRMFFLMLVLVGVGLLPVSHVQAAGPYRVKNIRPSASAYPTEHSAFGGKLYFAARGSATGVELFVSDGTEQGTNPVKDIHPDSSGDVRYLTVPGDRMLFSARDHKHGAELWQSDGTMEGTQLLKDIYPGGSGSPHLTKVVQGNFFSRHTTA